MICTSLKSTDPGLSFIKYRRPHLCLNTGTPSGYGRFGIYDRVSNMLTVKYGQTKWFTRFLQLLDNVHMLNSYVGNYRDMHYETASPLVNLGLRHYFLWSLLQVQNTNDYACLVLRTSAIGTWTVVHTPKSDSIPFTITFKISHDEENSRITRKIYRNLILKKVM